MSRFAVTHTARADIVAIWDHIADEGGPDAADRLAQDLHDAMLRLAEFPRIGRELPELGRRAVRIWFVHSYFIVYRPTTRPIQILRVLHASRDLQALLDL